MIGARMVVGAPVVDVFADAVSPQPAADAFPGDRLAAVRAAEQAAAQRNIGRSGSPVAAVHDVLAGVERRSVDEPPVASLEDLPVAVQLTDVELVAEDVRECRAVEAGLADGLPVQHTGREGGGYQVWLRCPEPGRNDKLAWVPDEQEKIGRRIAIETRGEGGYAILPGSLHPSGRTYQTIAGNFANIPTVPQALGEYPGDYRVAL